MDENGTTNTSIHDQQYYKQWPEGLLYFITLLVLIIGGTLGNIMVIIATLMHRKLHRPGNLFIVNLSLADLGVSLIINIFNVVGIIRGDEIYHKDTWLCVGLAYFCTATCITSLLNIVMIAVNRYIVLLHYHVAPRIFTWKNTSAMCVAVWILGALLCSPPFYGFGRYGYDTKTMMCFFDRTHSTIFTLYLALMIMGFPLVTIAVLYLRIFLFVRSRRRALMMHSKNHSPHSRRSKKEREETRLTRTLFFVFVSFVVCWTPITFVSLLDTTNSLPGSVHILVLTIAHLSSSGLNFLIYGVTNSQFREGYLKVIRCGKRDEASQDSEGGNSSPSYQNIRA